MVDGQTVRGILDIFGFQLPPVQINIVLLVGIIVTIYWTRRLVVRTRWPEWIDTVVCWGGPWAWAMVYLWAVERPMPWIERVNWALVYSMFAAAAYALFAWRVLEAAWGPVWPAPPAAGQGERA
jgi:hypothetical protein